MDRQFVISHLHGQLRSLERLLGKWNPEHETLVVLGDSNDYGPNSFLVYKRLLELKEAFGERIVFLKGSHELLFEKFQANPSIYSEEYFDNGGAATLASFYHDGLTFEEINNPYYLVEEILPKIDFTELQLYLSKCVTSFETETSLFVSKETASLKSQLIESWEKVDGKKLFVSLKSDEEFKIDYFSKLAKEWLAVKTHVEELPYLMREDKSQVDIKSVSIEHVSNTKEMSDLRPFITGYKIKNGVLQEEIEVPTEE